MTTDWPRPGAVLVRAKTPPSVDGGVVDVRPAPVATFDGDRHRNALVVNPDRSAVRVTYPWHGLPAALEAAGNHLRELDLAVVRLGNRAWLRGARPDATVRGIERRLAAAARREGATLLTWTDGALLADDRSLYDAVFE